MNVPKAIVEALLNGRLIPFIGAGMSMPSGLPSWASLVKSLAGQSRPATVPEESLASVLSLPDLAEVLDSISGSEQHTLEYLADRVDDPRYKPNRYHAMLEHLRPTTIVTTNWDRLIEDSFRAAGHRTTVITRDVDVPAFNTASHINVIKLHGTITDRQTLVYRKSQYESYWSTRSLLQALMQVQLSTNHALFLGYGFGDPNIIDLLSRLTVSSGKFRRQHWAFTYHSSQLEEMWRHLGVQLIHADQYGANPTEATENFLNALVSASGTKATSNLQRAELVNRELASQIASGRSHAVLRMRATLGWLSNPTPDTDSLVYGTPEQDAAERRMTELVLQFARSDETRRVRSILNIDSGVLLRKYSRSAARRRLMQLRDSILSLGSQAQVVHTTQENNLNEMLFDDDAGLIGFKLPSTVGIHRVFIQRSRSTVRSEVEQFDSDYWHCVKMYSRSDDQENMHRDARDAVIARISDQLRVLDRPFTELNIDGASGAADAGDDFPFVHSVARALAFAIEAHDAQGQTREDRFTPYWVHVVRVMERLRAVAEQPSEEVLLAALLHDVVEDTEVTVRDLSDQFGNVVAEIVADVTQSEGQAYEDYVEQIRNGTREARMLKLADRWDNVSELTAMRYESFGDVSPCTYIKGSSLILDVCRDASETLATFLRQQLAIARDVFNCEDQLSV